ncbi:hypothetical protein [Oceanicoccus sagamiensis]|uniref:Nitrate/nitrite sensing protein domain-containing protein n=1 Tax=Oceanicoccus sagamiensis TaxID=716816 RepID=A0A1X9N6M5_9GAMM|nr:hypothetical protein [Oceanicoccus sagamiensis]ARN73748.1 hypothetical protein BST96_06235 [Oceanicoccus sagamiensis]
MHLIEPQTSQSEALSTTFKQLQQGLTTLKLLCQLTQLLQHHRGSSMAYLSGSQDFLPQIEKLQLSIETALQLINELNHSYYRCIPEDLLNNINNDWKTIAMGWQQDQVMPNFEFHSHLVDSCNKLLRLCMVEQLRPLMLQGNSRHQNLLELIFITFPNSIENLAMLRGLSTNVAVIKACGTESHAKISFLIKEIEQQNKVLLGDIITIKSDIDLIKNYQKPLHKFLLTVKLSILESPDITADSSQLFKMSTDIINTQWNAVGQGMQRIEDSLYRLLISA